MGSFVGDFGDNDGSRVETVLFVVVPVLIGVIGLIVVAVIGTVVVRGLQQWRRNNQAPLLTVPASVVAKRDSVRHRGSDAGSSTTYFATFELEGGERLEFLVRGKEFGMLAERDRGQLSYQGTRYKAFERTPPDR